MDTFEQVESRDAGLADGIKKNAGLTVVSGVVLLIAGTLAIFSPFVAGVSITILVGAMLAVSGIGQCFLAFKTGAFGRGLMVFIVGVLMAIAGFYMMNQSVAGLATLIADGKHEERRIYFGFTDSHIPVHLQAN